MSVSLLWKSEMLPWQLAFDLGIGAKDFTVELKLGNNVMSLDGQMVGHIQGFVLDFSSRRVEQVIIRSGLSLVHDRMLPRNLVDHVEHDDIVVLSIPLADVLALPEYFDQVIVEEVPEQIGDMPVEWIGSGTGAPPVYFGAQDESFGYRRSDPFFVYGPVIPPTLNVEANVPGRDIVVGTTTTVIASDGKTIGHVEELDVAADGHVEHLSVKTGHVRHHHVTLPGEYVEGMSSEHVRLNIGSDQMPKPEPAV